MKDNVRECGCNECLEKFSKNAKMSTELLLGELSKRGIVADFDADVQDFEGACGFAAAYILGVLDLLERIGMNGCEKEQL